MLKWYLIVFQIDLKDILKDPKQYNRIPTIEFQENHESITQIHTSYLSYFLH